MRLTRRLFELVLPLATLATLGALAASCAKASATDDSYTDLPPRGDGGRDGGGAEDDSGPRADASATDSAPTPDASEPACDPSKPFGTPVAITELNTADEDILVDVSPDGLTTYVATNHLVTGVHLFFAARAGASAAFGGLQPLFPGGTFDDWAVSLTSDGLTAIVASDRSGNSELMVATRPSTLAAFGALGIATGPNSTGDEAGPRWSADGKTLYFDSTRSGTRSIWRTAVVGATFGTPQKLTELASGAEDGVPVLSPDELTIYFYSTRAPTTNGDIYVATRSSKTLPFANVQVLANVNGPTLDAPAHVSPDGCALYLSTVRAATGKFDIFVARRPK